MIAGPEIAVFDGVAFSCVGDTCLVVYASPARIDRTRWLFDRVDEAVADLDTTLCALMLILPTSDPPDAVTRAENDRRLRLLRGKLRRLVTVTIGDSFRLNLVRTMMRGLFLMQRQSQLLSVATSLEEGLRCVHREATKQTHSGTLLGARVKQMCRMLGHDPESL